MFRLLKCWLLAAGVAAILAPVFVHVAFSVEAPCSALIPTWTSGDVLAYIGALLGAIATIVAVFLTIKNSEETRKEDLRLSVLPCIAVQDLRRVNRKSFIDVVREQSAPNSDDGVTAKEPYAEVKIDREYAVYSAEGFHYCCGLADEQRKKIEYHSVIPTEDAPGVMLFAANTSAYLPLLFSNVGNGTAVNCCISVVKAEGIRDVQLEGLLSCSIRQMTVGSERYLGVYFDDCTPDCRGKYQIVVMYEDTYGNRYVQDFVLEIVPADDPRGNSLTMGISRHRRQGNDLID